MTEATTRADIVTQVESVSNIGVVYDYVRYADTWDKFLELFKTTISGEEVIRGWTITCISFNETQLGYGDPGTVQRDYVYQIRGYFGVDDSTASEKAAMIVAEDVVETLRSSVESGSDAEGNLPAALTIFEGRIFGDVLCHYAEITLSVRSLI